MLYFLSLSPFSLFLPLVTGLLGAGCGLEDGTGRLLGTGVAPALDCGSFGAGSNVGAFVGRGEALDGVGPGVLLKNPAILCCFPPDFCVDPPVFLGAVRGVAISLPSIPRAMV